MNNSFIELERLLKEEYFLHPISDTPSGIDVFESILRPVSPVKTRLPAGLVEKIEQTKNIVLVLVDGMGINIFDHLPDRGFLKKHFYSELRAVYPSATASALVSYASLNWPGKHAVTGWDTYIPDRNLAATVLTFLERESGKPLSGFHTSMIDVIPVKSAFNTPDRDVRVLFPERVARSDFSNWFAAGTLNIGYRNLLEAINSVKLRLDDPEDSSRRSLTYVYIPNLDTTEHFWGPHHDNVLLELLGVERFIELLSDAVDGRAVILIIADHGQVYVPPDRQYDVTENEKMLSFLEIPPTGEPRNPVFHVKEGMERQFEDLFMGTTRGDFLLMKPDDAERLSLLGPGPLSAEMKRRLGTCIGVAVNPSVVWYFPSSERKVLHLGFHGGLSSEEMRIPLIVV